MLNLKSLRSEPFLWIHLSGIVLVPICWALTIVGLSVGASYPLGEFSLLVLVGIIPILWMQLTRPFDIFSVLFLSLKPEALNEDRKAILSLFKTWTQKLVSMLAAGISLVVLWLLYRLAPLTYGAVNFIPYPQAIGSILAAIAFLASNLFLQVPLSVLLVLRTKQAKLNRTEAYPAEHIKRDFTVPGIELDELLWLVKAEEFKASSTQTLST